MSSSRAIPKSLDPEVVAKIDASLLDLEEDGTRIAWAIESGSRAWGFPSPDSDYDCRFIYIRPFNDYLTPWPKRDVIELPLDPVFDVNGWDFIKAVRLLVKGNATVPEWLNSPIIYKGDTGFRDRFLELANDIVNPSQLTAHHLHVAQLQWPQNLDHAKLKKVLYGVRSAATLAWLRQTGDRVPPMDLPTLLAQIELDQTAHVAIDKLVQRKLALVEAAHVRVPRSIASFVEREFDLAAHQLNESPPQPDRKSAQAKADIFFQEELSKER
jgi:predicted nucleotidyltransferase